MLLIRGPSRIGKTKMAQAIFPNSFVTTVNGAAEPDLRGFDPLTHKAIVLDQVNDLEFILGNRGILQANAEDHTLAVTQSHTFSYNVWTFRIPIILTLDLGVDMKPFEDEKASGNNWLTTNCELLDLPNEPTYHENGPAQVVEPASEPAWKYVCRPLSDFIDVEEGLTAGDRMLAEREFRLGDLPSQLRKDEDPGKPETGPRHFEWKAA